LAIAEISDPKIFVVGIHQCDKSGGSVHAQPSFLVVVTALLLVVYDFANLLIRVPGETVSTSEELKDVPGDSVVERNNGTLKKARDSLRCSVMRWVIYDEILQELLDN
jgi:hypothetical protein